MQLFEGFERELAEEIKRQVRLLKAAEASELVIFYENHPDYDDVPINIKTRISKNLHQATLETTDLLCLLLT
jgi:hypothetical protein